VSAARRKRRRGERLDIDEILAPFGWPRRRVYLDDCTVLGQDDEGNWGLGTIATGINGRVTLVAFVLLGPEAVDALRRQCAEDVG
jgi:hypothetical protein